MMITQFLWNILKYKAFFPGFVTSLFLLLMLQDMLSEKSDFADLMTLKVRIYKLRSVKHFCVECLQNKTNNCSIKPLSTIAILATCIRIKVILTGQLKSKLDS